MNPTASSQPIVRAPAGLDPEIWTALAALAPPPSATPPPAPAPGDWQAQRRASNGFYDAVARQAATYPAAQMTPYVTQAADGTDLALRWYVPATALTGSAVVYAHGGGLVAGDLNRYDAVVRRYVQESGLPFLAVEYRLAPEVQGRTPAEDVFAGLRWLRGQAGRLGIDPQRLAVMGDSAGGGIAAGVAILARDRQVPLAHQLLVYPLLDDRIFQQPLEARLQTAPVLVYEASYTGWKALLGHEPGLAATPDPVAVPGRLTDFAGLAPAYVEAGDLDALRDEAIAYARQLARAGVPIELHVHPGVPHAFDLVAPQAAVTRRAMQDRVRVLQAI